ncbi:signal peptidase complex component, putative [Talaromyces stipitatus ATCC 10500]|uniref:Signal peptidase complex subunit 2 n=1 Tax=Talaromyces stipitatus (strain ATCC 10500 / CBS 375.48 / QM 6759 / NRRL 1006) TaxID=441959 RepID=B8MQK1_TALSN|nr:signal peptidase complex component, putative [Talaromyces stipitatus ATCC 10500]EED13403.1 signal peptidase complex component, putative [Talaromyces stipitatus ATCC 10500]
MTSTAAPKVPVYSLNDLKSTTDDALTPYLSTLPQPYTFRRDNTKLTIRFILGYTAVAIAGVTFYLDRQLGWEATQATWVKIAVVAYFVLNSILTYWIWAVEAGEVFRGVRRDGSSITIQSSTKKHTPIYKVKITYTSSKGKIIQQKEIESPFTAWFSSTGIFHPEPFRAWLAREVDVLREAERETLKKTGDVSGLVGVDESGSKRKGKK